MAASRTLFSPGKVIRNLAPPCEDASASLQESERAAGLQGFRVSYQPFGRCGALFALCGHSYILGVIHKRRAFYEKAFRQLVTGD